MPIVRNDRIIAAECRRIAGPLAPDLRRHPHATVGVHHRVVRVRGIVVATGVRRGATRPRTTERAEAKRFHLFITEALVRLFAPRGVEAIARRHLDPTRRVRVGIDHEQVVVREVDTVDRSAGVHGRIAFVRCDLVMRVGVRIAPRPLRDHDIAFETLRAWRCGGRLTGRDTRAPPRQRRDGRRSISSPRLSQTRARMPRRSAVASPPRRVDDTARSRV